jgi:TolB protein
VSNVSGGWDVYAFTMSKAFRKLASTGAQASAPAWSPDGSQVAYQSNREGSWAIYVVGSGGGDSRRLVNLGAQHPNWQLERMSWSP